MTDHLAEARRLAQCRYTDIQLEVISLATAIEHLIDAIEERTPKASHHEHEFFAGPDGMVCRCGQRRGF